MGDIFVKCPYCDTQLYIDRSGVLFFYIMPYFINNAGAQGIFKRWAASNAVRGMDRQAQDVSMKQQYYPIYFFKRDIKGKEKIILEPARSTTLPGLHSLRIPAGDIHVFDKGYQTSGVELLKPDVSLAAYLPGLPGTAKEQALVYFPIWYVEFMFNGRRYELVIDGSSGDVFAADSFTRKGPAYMIVAVSMLIIFLAEGALGWVLSPNFVVSWGLAFFLMLVTIMVFVTFLYARRF